MADKSRIEWTDATWNPTVGCSKVSEGCRNCYAIRQARRQDRPGSAYEGTTTPEPNWSGRVNEVPDRLDAPLRWRAPRRVFVDSMSDLFHEKVPFGFVDKVFAVMAMAERHTFQVLTKRPQRMADYVGDPAVCGRVHEAAFKMKGVSVAQPGKQGTLEQTWPTQGWPSWPLPNVWLGISVENQAAADERIPHLLRTPAAVRFLSCEPLLGPVDLEPFLMVEVPLLAGDADVVPRHAEPRLHWVIVGGESGPGARPMHPDWPRGLRDQCAEAGVPYFFKQWGEWLPRPQQSTVGVFCKSAPDAAVMPDGTIEPPSVGTLQGGVGMDRMGKRVAGHLLDGKEHRAFPKALP